MEAGEVVGYFVWELNALVAMMYVCFVARW